MSQISGISSSLAQDQFLQLLVSQLRNQDPLNPVSDKDFIAQLSQLSQLESLQNLDANFAEVLKLQQLTSGTNLIGKTVKFTDADDLVQTGKVTGVTVNEGKFVLSVGQQTVSLDNVLSAS